MCLVWYVLYDCYLMKLIFFKYLPSDRPIYSILEDIFNTSNHNKLKNTFVSWRLHMSYTESI